MQKNALSQKYNVYNLLYQLIEETGGSEPWERNEDPSWWPA